MRKQSVLGTYKKAVGIVRLPGNTQFWLMPSCSKNFNDPSRNITQMNSFPLTVPKLPLQNVNADFCKSCWCNICNFDCWPTIINVNKKNCLEGHIANECRHIYHAQQFPPLSKANKLLAFVDAILQWHSVALAFVCCNREISDEKAEFENFRDDMWQGMSFFL